MGNIAGLGNHDYQLQQLDNLPKEGKKGKKHKGDVKDKKASGHEPMDFDVRTQKEEKTHKGEKTKKTKGDRKLKEKHGQFNNGLPQGQKILTQHDAVRVLEVPAEKNGDTARVALFFDQHPTTVLQHDGKVEFNFDDQSKVEVFETGQVRHTTPFETVPVTYDNVMSFTFSPSGDVKDDVTYSFPQADLNANQIDQHTTAGELALVVNLGMHLTDEGELNTDILEAFFAQEGAALSPDTLIQLLTDEGVDEVYFNYHANNSADKALALFWDAQANDGMGGTTPLGEAVIVAGGFSEIGDDGLAQLGFEQTLADWYEGAETQVLLDELSAVYGPDADVAAVLAKIQAIMDSDGEYSLPEIKLVDSETLGGNRGAFADANLNENLADHMIFLNNNLSLEAQIEVLAEEMGHYFDTVANPAGDGVGDEGNLFALALVDRLFGEDDPNPLGAPNGEHYSLAARQAMEETGDTGTINMPGVGELMVEFSSLIMPVDPDYILREETDKEGVIMLPNYPSYPSLSLGGQNTSNHERNLLATYFASQDWTEVASLLQSTQNPETISYAIELKLHAGSPRTFPFIIANSDVIAPQDALTMINVFDEQNEHWEMDYFLAKYHELPQMDSASLSAMRNVVVEHIMREHDKGGDGYLQHGGRMLENFTAEEFSHIAGLAQNTNARDISRHDLNAALEQGLVTFDTGVLHPNRELLSVGTINLDIQTLPDSLKNSNRVQANFANATHYDIRNGIYTIYFNDGESKHFLENGLPVFDAESLIQKLSDDGLGSYNITHLEMTESELDSNVSVFSIFHQVHGEFDGTRKYNLTLSNGSENLAKSYSFDVEHKVASPIDDMLNWVGDEYNKLTLELENWEDAHLGNKYGELAGYVAGLGEEAIKFVASSVAMGLMVLEGAYVTVDEISHALLDDDHEFWSSEQAQQLSANMKSMVEDAWTFIKDLPSNSLHLLNGYVLVNDPSLQQDPKFVNPSTTQGHAALQSAMNNGFELYAPEHIRSEYDDEFEFSGSHDDYRFGETNDGNPHHFRYGKAFGQLIGVGIAGVVGLFEGGEGLRAKATAFAKHIESKGGLSGAFYDMLGYEEAPEVMIKDEVTRLVSDGAKLHELQSVFNGSFLDGAITNNSNGELVISVKERAPTGTFDSARIEATRQRIEGVLGHGDFEFDFIDDPNEPLPTPARVKITENSIYGTDYNEGLMGGGAEPRTPASYFNDVLDAQTAESYINELESFLKSTFDDNQMSRPEIQIHADGSGPEGFETGAFYDPGNHQIHISEGGGAVNVLDGAIFEGFNAAVRGEYKSNDSAFSSRKITINEYGDKKANIESGVTLNYLNYVNDMRDRGFSITDSAERGLNRYAEFLGDDPDVAAWQEAFKSTAHDGAGGLTSLQQYIADKLSIQAPRAIASIVANAARDGITQLLNSSQRSGLGAAAVDMAALETPEGGSLVNNVQIYVYLLDRVGGLDEVPNGHLARFYPDLPQALMEIPTDIKTRLDNIFNEKLGL